MAILGSAWLCYATFTRVLWVTFKGCFPARILCGYSVRCEVLPVNITVHLRDVHLAHCVVITSLWLSKPRCGARVGGRALPTHDVVCSSVLIRSRAKPVNHFGWENAPGQIQSARELPKRGTTKPSLISSLFSSIDAKMTPGVPCRLIALNVSTLFYGRQAIVDVMRVTQNIE